jgi:uncharacterized protein involved in exopolysaccharide biosynthesis
MSDLTAPHRHRWVLAFVEPTVAHLRLLVAVGVLTAGLGASVAMLRSRQYVTTATLTVTSGELGNLSGLAGLAGLAGQFGLSGSLPNGEEWSDDLVAQLLRSTTLLREIVVDSIVAPKGPGRMMIADLLRKPPSEESDSARIVRIERAAEDLGKKVIATTDRRTNAITLSVRTKWPDVSVRVTERLISDLDDHLFRLSQTRARNERRSLEARITAQDSLVLTAEAAAAAFVLQNRGYAMSPASTFTFERLQREVTLRQQVRVTLAQVREQMIAKEVRSSPVVTTVEAPRRAVKAESRRLALHLAAGGLAGFSLALFLVLSTAGLREAARNGDPTAQTLLAWLDRRLPTRRRPRV